MGKRVEEARAENVHELSGHELREKARAEIYELWARAERESTSRVSTRAERARTEKARAERERELREHELTES